MWRSVPRVFRAECSGAVVTRVHCEQCAASGHPVIAAGGGPKGKLPQKAFVLPGRRDDTVSLLKKLIGRLVLARALRSVQHCIVGFGKERQMWRDGRRGSFSWPWGVDRIAFVQLFEHAASDATHELAWSPRPAADRKVVHMGRSLAALGGNERGEEVRVDRRSRVACFCL